MRTQTDENGFFSLRCPAGRFFVHVDGRTAWESQWPDGDYYPFVGKTFEAVAGRTNNPAGGTGQIFLPLVRAGTRQTVSATPPTTVPLPPVVLADPPSCTGCPSGSPAQRNPPTNDGCRRRGRHFVFACISGQIWIM